MKRKAKRSKALWVGVYPEQRQKANSTGRHTSEQLNLYRKTLVITKGWMCYYPACKSCETEPHHMRGRSGDLLWMPKYIIPLCNKHHRWVHRNIEKARALNLICEKGLWGKQP